MGDPVVQIVLGLEDRADDVDDSEVGALDDVDVGSVFVLGQHEACLSPGQEVDVADLIALEVNVLPVGVGQWLEQGTNPGDERRRFSFEQENLLVGGLMDVERNLQFEFVGQVVYELVDVVLVFVEVVLDRLSQPFVQIER